MLTPEHLSQMRHAVDFYSVSRPGFRNYFSAEETDPIWADLVELGFAAGRDCLGSYVFHVTESGQKLIGLDEQIAMVKYMNEESFGADE